MSSSFPGFGQESSEIQEIRAQFKLWQIHLKEKKLQAMKFFHIYTGDNFSIDKWVDTVDSVSDAFVGEEINIYKIKDVGSVLFIDETSPSGDWFARSEHYYWPSGKLYFVFWAMNTFNAEPPSTVERRIYFNKKGDVIRRLESVYKMNTRQKIKEPNYMDKKVIYWRALKNLPVFKDYKLE